MVFYARIIIDAPQGPVELDARSSDAIAVALRAQVPLYVNKSILDKAAITIDQPTW